MLDLDRSLRLISREFVGQYDLYVVDASLNVVLSGRALTEIAPPGPDTALPPDVAAALAMLAHDHDFEREHIASVRTRALRQVRVVKMTGPAGDFYGVMVAEPMEPAG